MRKARARRRRQAPMIMLDVGAKPRTERVAVARGLVAMSAETLAVLERGEAEKGDVLAAARIAGVMAAKRTPELIPLCHPIALTGVEVDAFAQKDGVEIVATVRTLDRTGVEMEALSAVSAACLTVYDMLKRHERGMQIRAVELLAKSGGRSGDWQRPGPARAGRSARSAGGSPPRPASRVRAGARPGR